MDRPILRQYQKDNLNEVYEKFKTMQAGIWCLPTGGGKGTGAAAIVHYEESIGHRIMFFTYGQPLVEDQFKRVTDLGIDAGMIMGSGKSSNRKPWCATQVASISTLWRRESLPRADVVICDEIQDCTSRTYRSVLDRYLASGSRILGLSATPVGPRGAGLGKESGGVFEFMVTGPSVKELIRDGYLVSCKLYCFDHESLKNVKKKGDDYDQSALAALAAANAHRVGDIVGNWKNYASDRKTVAFGVDQADVHRIVDQFNASGINAAVVLDDTSPEERSRIYRDFDHGDLRVIGSCAVLGRGWDHSVAKCIVDAAGTLSVQKALQRWGRGSRPHKGYSDFVLLDFAGNYWTHGRYEALREWNLNGPPRKISGDGEPDYRIKTCPKCRFPFKFGPKECPRCGHVIPIKEREVREADGHLRLIDIEEERQEIKRKEQQEQKQEAIEAWAARATDEEKLRKLDQWKQQAKDKGMKASWAYGVFRRVFNCDPPKKTAPPPPDERSILNDWDRL